LEVIDRATDDVLQRLIAAGLLAKTTRGSRPLTPLSGEPHVPPSLSPEEQARKQSHREKAARSRDIAGVLAAAGFESEARNHLLESILHQSRVFAVQSRLPEPDNIQNALVPPISILWGEKVNLLREYLANPTKPCRFAMEALTDKMVE